MRILASDIQKNVNTKITCPLCNVLSVNCENYDVSKIYDLYVGIY